MREHGHLRFIWKGHDESDEGIFVTVCQNELYTVSHSIFYDKLIGPNHDPMKPKDKDQRTCSFKDLMESESLDCLDLFVMDVVSTHMNTTDLHATPQDKVFHIPAMFGDDFAYSNATHNFLFIDKLAQLLEKHSFERYGVQMRIKYSTVREYLTALHTDSPDIHYPTYRGDFFPYLQEVPCEENDKTCWRGHRIDHWNGYYSSRIVMKAKIRDIFYQLRTSQKLFSTY